MLKILAFVFAVLCTAHAFTFKLRDGQIEDAKEKRGEESELGTLTHSDIWDAMRAAKHFVYPYKGTIDHLVGEVLKPVERDRQDWLNLVTNVADVMNGGAAIYEGTLKSFENALEIMFKGENEFRKEAQCHQLWVTVHQDDFGKEDWHVSQMLYALAKDLICMDNLLSELYDLEAHIDEDHELSEMDVLKGTLKGFADLFKLRNSGSALFIAMKKATKTYNDEDLVKGIHEHFNSQFKSEKKSVDTNAVLEKLLAALEKKRH